MNVIAFRPKLTTPPEAVELIKRWEGVHDGNPKTALLEPQKDPIGIPTLGYGAIYGLDGQRVTMDHRAITLDEAKALLMRDLVRFENAVRSLITIPMHPLMFGALVSFTYNLGQGNLRASTLRRRINNQRWEDVPRQFRRWNKAEGKVLRGLTLRRSSEADMFMEGLVQLSEELREAA